MTMFLIELESCKSFWEVDFYHLRRRRRQQSTALLHNLVSFKRFDHNKMVKKALFVLLTSSFTKGEQACGTTADCNDGELCNFDDGESGGFCEPCPGETDQDCVDSGYITDLGTAECKRVCVVEQSEFIKNFEHQLVLICVTACFDFRPSFEIRLFDNCRWPKIVWNLFLL